MIYLDNNSEIQQVHIPRETLNVETVNVIPHNQLADYYTKSEVDDKDMDLQIMIATNTVHIQNLQADVESDVKVIESDIDGLETDIETINGKIRTINNSIYDLMSSDAANSLTKIALKSGTDVESKELGKYVANEMSYQLATINGQSILGNKDIVVEGGSTGGGTATHIYPMQGDWTVEEVYNNFLAGDICYIQLEDGRMGLITDVSNMGMIRLNGLMGDENGDAKPNRFECSSPYGISVWKLAFLDEIPLQYTYLGTSDSSTNSVYGWDLYSSYWSNKPAVLYFHPNGKTAIAPISTIYDNLNNRYVGAVVIGDELWKWDGEVNEYIRPTVVSLGGSADMEDYYTKSETDSLIANLELGDGGSISEIVDSAVAESTSGMNDRIDEVESRMDALETGNGGDYDTNPTFDSITVNGTAFFNSEMVMAGGGQSGDSDIASGIACAFKAGKSQSIDLWTRTIHSGTDGENIYFKTSPESDAKQLAMIDTSGNIYEGETKLSDKYVLKSDYDALLARIEALENK